MSSAQHTRRDYAALIGQRGYVVLFHRAGENHCPSCGKSNWIIGRTSAECAFCDLAIPLAEPVGPEIHLDPETERKA
ncbi:hypothetical protein QQS45_00120 [Alteriqipengyuania flavescens]|uniref:hypothetical protein n=1 Tax=Alteriqipengyuania flavescens TaxID=3053610 RepID=UPI0025B49613|nr:hypothetical protein [Alteriqipengyuania flavescens]WJY18695.1 hypothetical protein QQW98_00120 [Alteriqipengyuania flavescens]WJY24635.1 hypothetical protein QQS45_00120 [Alteriqipengyuania flavescens]